MGSNSSIASCMESNRTIKCTFSSICDVVYVSHRRLLRMRMESTQTL